MPDRAVLVLTAWLFSSLALAAGDQCSEEVGLRSTEGAVSTSIAFTNQMPIALRIYWLNYEGIRQFYGIVGPRQTHRQPTYVTHPWVLTDSNDDCVAVYMPGHEPRQVFVTGESAPLPPTPVDTLRPSAPPN
jgi:hypothetical protein